MMDKVVHFEVPADNTARAQKFYNKVFGWNITKAPTPKGAPEYYMVRTVEVDKNRMPKERGAINGGLMKRSVPGESPVVVISVPSISGYVKKIQASGGKIILQKMPIGEMGFYARFQDTEGNVVGLWENAKKAKR
ncbi:MAG: VOC family protein [Candidatus Aenigmarchaeota archaeon]|nr:VOC family protein [Candidatus Aenigmarchaeota archaeon]